MNDVFLDWAKVHCPHFVKTFERSKIPFNSLIIGTKLLALRAGYSGMKGVYRKVVSEIKEEPWGRYVELGNMNQKDGDRISLLIEFDEHDGHWSSQVIVISDFEALRKMNKIETYNWEIENIGCLLEDYDYRNYHVRK